MAIPQPIFTRLLPVDNTTTYHLARTSTIQDLSANNIWFGGGQCQCDFDADTAGN